MAKLYYLAKITCCLLWLWTSWATANNEEQVEQHMMQLQHDISSLQKWLSKAQNQSSELQKQLRNHEQKISLLTKTIKQNRLDNHQATVRMEKLQTQAGHLQDALSDQEQRLSSQLKRQYQQGQNPTGNILLNLNNPASLARNMAYYQYLNQAGAEQIAAYRQTLETLAQVQQHQADLGLTLQLKAEQLELQTAQLQQTKQKLANNLSLLKSKQVSQSERLSTAKADQQQAQELLDQIQIATAKANIKVADQPFIDVKGQLPWPLKGTVLNRFGVMQSSYPLSQQGWLISAKEGTDVVAVHGGQVVFSDWLKGYGLVIILDHGNDFLSLYGQNQALYLSVGDLVSAQQLIASSGKSGGNDKTGLYFSLRKQGQPLNPQHWLQ